MADDADNAAREIPYLSYSFINNSFSYINVYITFNYRWLFNVHQVNGSVALINAVLPPRGAR